MIFEQWEIKKSVIADTERAFRSRQTEVFVMWNALLTASPPRCTICRAMIPEQQAGFAPDGGAYVHISGAELANTQFLNYERNERAIAQLHTHPGSDVTMSPLDRKWEVVSHVGALSIIVPSFGKLGLGNFSGVNVYEREDRGWRLWTAEETTRRIQVK